jgi:DNA-binding GntR family transcriptional regulator
MGKKLSEEIFGKVRGDIISGKYSARDFISESEIAKEYGVSKAPVKEALHLLADQGYLVSFPRKGYMVNTFTRAEVNQIQEVRRCLESLCVQRAIEYATDEEIASLRTAIADTTKSDEPEKTVNYRFHMQLAEISGNPVLPQTLERLVNIASMTQLHREADVDNFQHIIDAIAARDLELATEWICKDISYL